MFRAPISVLENVSPSVHLHTTRRMMSKVPLGRSLRSSSSFKQQDTTGPLAAIDVGFDAASSVPSRECNYYDPAETLPYRPECYTVDRRFLIGREHMHTSPIR